MRGIRITLNLNGRVQMQTRDAAFREAEHPRDNGGRFAETAGGGVGRIAPDPHLHEQAHQLRPRTDNIRAIRKLAEYTRYLASIDRAKGTGNPAQALARIPIRSKHTAVIAYRDALVRAYGGSVAPAATPAAPSRPVTVAPPVARAAPSAATPPPAAAPAGGPTRATPEQQQRATMLQQAQSIRPNPETHHIASSRPQMREWLGRMDEAMRLPQEQRVAALQAIHISQEWPRSLNYRNALIRAEGGTAPGGAPSLARAHAPPAPPVQPPPPPQNPEANKARTEYNALNVHQRRYTPDVKASLDSMPGSEALSNAFVAGFPADASVITSTSTFGGRQSIAHEISGYGRVSREINWQELSVYHSYQALTDRAQGNGAGSKNLEASILAYKAAGLKKVKVSAGLSVGGYAWAKFGFVPSAQGWRALAGGVKRRVEANRTLTPADKMQLGKILASADPKALWVLSDHPKGKQFLLGNSWQGTLDLEDKACYDRCLKYARRNR